MATGKRIDWVVVMCTVPKACAEILYRHISIRFFSIPNVRVCSARAGNVIGGGDWAKDRVVVDMIRAWSSGASVEIRSPKATRPWQHVLNLYLVTCISVKGSPPIAHLMGNHSILVLRLSKIGL